MGWCIWGVWSYVLGNLALLILKVCVRKCFGSALWYMGIDVLHKLFGFDCDELNINRGEWAVKGLLQVHKPMLVLLWCMAHWLDLAIKDHLFYTFNEILVCTYYFYSKSLKKCQDIKVVVEWLKFYLHVISSASPQKVAIRLLHCIVC